MSICESKKLFVFFYINKRYKFKVSKTASAYVSLTVEVINDFKQTHSSSEKSSTHQLELIERCIQAAIDSICLKYHSNASDLLESVRKMEDNLRMLQRVRRTNTAAAAATNAANTISDDDKIRMQLHLDVVEFGRLCAEKFNGYKGESNYDALLKLVEDAAAVRGNNNVNATNSSSPSMSSLPINNTTTSTTTNNTPANDKTQSFMNQNSEIV